MVLSPLRCEIITDKCFSYNDFTEGQKLRMHAMWKTVRDKPHNGSAQNITVRNTFTKKLAKSVKLF